MTQLDSAAATTAGQVLTSLPGVAAVRAAAFAAHSLPIERFPTPDHLYSATGLAPSSYQSASVNRRGAISRHGLPEHRDALMAHRLGPLAGLASLPRTRDVSYRVRGFAPIQPASHLPATPAASATPSFAPNSPTTNERYRQRPQVRAVTANTAMPHDGVT